MNPSISTSSLPRSILNGGQRLALHATSLGWGGTERYVEDLSIAYSKAGLDPLVIVDGPPLVRYPNMREAGVKVRLLNVPAGVKEEVYCACLAETLRSEKIGLLHANVWMRWPWIQETCIRNNITCIKTNHCTTSFGFRELMGLNGPRAWYNMWSARLYASRIRPNIISISGRSYLGLKSFYKKDVQTTQVHLGVPPAAVRSRPADRGQGPTFVWIGSLIPRKRPLLLLKAFKAVIEKFPHASLTIAGDGPMRQVVEQYTEREALPNVHVLGFTDNIQRVLAEGQVLVLTSLDEGLPYVVLEAMAAGMPVIATNCGAVREAVSDGVSGTVVPLNSQSELIQAMLRLAGDPEQRRNMGNAGHEIWKREFTLERMVGETLNAYEKLSTVSEGQRNDFVAGKGDKEALDGSQQT